MLRGGGGKPLAGPVAGRLTLVELLVGRGKVEAPPQLGCCKDNMANPPNPIQENTSIHKHKRRFSFLSGGPNWPS